MASEYGVTAKIFMVWVANRVGIIIPHYFYFSKEGSLSLQPKQDYKLV